MHAEAIKVTYDSAVISLKDLLSVFMDAHDPTHKNRQGNDVGTQYRSAIFVNDDEERAIAEDAIAAEQKRLGKPVATTVEALSTFYPGEEYHQGYLAQRGQTAEKGAEVPIRCYG